MCVTNAKSRAAHERETLAYFWSARRPFTREGNREAHDVVHVPAGVGLKERRPSEAKGQGLATTPLGGACMFGTLPQSDRLSWPLRFCLRTSLWKQSSLISLLVSSLCSRDPCVTRRGYLRGVPTIPLP